MPSARQNYSFSIDDILTITIFFCLCLMPVSAPPAPAPADSGDGDDDASQIAFNWSNLGIALLLAVVQQGWQCYTYRENKRAIAHLNSEIGKLKTDMAAYKKIQKDVLVKRGQLSQFPFGKSFFVLSGWHESDVLPYLDNFEHMLKPILAAIRLHVGIHPTAIFEEEQLSVFMSVVERFVREDLFAQGLLQLHEGDRYEVNLSGSVVISPAAIAQILGSISATFLEQHPSPRRMQSMPSFRAVGHTAMAAVRASSGGGGGGAAVDRVDADDSSSGVRSGSAQPAHGGARLRGLKVATPAAVPASAARQRSKRRNRGLKSGKGDATVTPVAALESIAAKRSGGPSGEDAAQGGAPAQPRGGLSPNSSGAQ